MRSQLRPLCLPLYWLCYHCLLDSVQGVEEQLIDFNSTLWNIQKHPSNTDSVKESILHFISEHLQINSFFLPRNVQSKENTSDKSILVTAPFMCVCVCVCHACVWVHVSVLCVLSVYVCEWVCACLCVCMHKRVSKFVYVCVSTESSKFITIS